MSVIGFGNGDKKLMQDDDTSDDTLPSPPLAYGSYKIPERLGRELRARAAREQCTRSEVIALALDTLFALDPEEVEIPRYRVWARPPAE